MLVVSKINPMYDNLITLSLLANENIACISGGNLQRGSNCSIFFLPLPLPTFIFSFRLLKADSGWQKGVLRGRGG